MHSKVQRVLLVNNQHFQPSLIGCCCSSCYSDCSNRSIIKLNYHVWLPDRSSIGDVAVYGPDDFLESKKSMNYENDRVTNYNDFLWPLAIHYPCFSRRY